MGDAAQPDGCATLAPLLSGLLDGELSRSERAAVKQHLRDCAACDRSLARARVARQALHRLRSQYDAPIRVPAQVGARRGPAQPRERHRRWPFGVIVGGVAAILAVLAVTAGLWFAHRDEGQTLTDRAVAVHRATTVTNPPLVPATDNAGDAARWASVATGRTIDVPELAAAGYRLLGVRAEPAIALHAVALVYVGAAGRLTCVIVPGHRALTGPAHGGTGVHLAEVGSTGVAGWWDEDDVTYLLVGDVGPDILLAVALQAAQP